VENLERSSAIADWPGDFLAESSAARLRKLYWLAYLLTGSRELSLQSVAETLDFPRSRRIFIAKTLARVASEIQASRLRMQTASPQDWCGVTNNFDVDRLVSKCDLEKALLPIDIFARCAVVLRAFERDSLEDTAMLLDADEPVVAAAQANGFMQLTRNLAAEWPAHSLNYTKN